MESRNYVCIIILPCGKGNRSNYLSDEGNVFEASPDDRRRLGVFSATLLIFNRIIGTGIFATPSTILSLSGSVGLSLIMWVAGTFIAMAGTAVYLEWGTAIPRYGSSTHTLFEDHSLTTSETEERKTTLNMCTRNPNSWPQPCTLRTRSC